MSIVWHGGKSVTSVSKRVLKRICKFLHLNDCRFKAQEKYIDDSILEEKQAKLYDGYLNVKR